MSEPNSTSHTGSSDAAAETGSSRPAKLKWTEDETQALVEGCNKHGVGSWTQILSDADLMPRFSDRTPGDLKDRFRTYFPDSYHEMYPNAKTHWGGQSRGKAPDGRSIFEKGKVKERRPFTEEEDRALLRGYKMYGSHWALIARDPAFKNQRRSTDVRDRFRNAFPEEYARAGYKPRSKAKSKSAKNKAAQSKEVGMLPPPSAGASPGIPGYLPQSVPGSATLPVSLNSSPAQTLTPESTPSPMFDSQIHATPIHPDYGFLHSQALLSPVMLRAAADNLPSFDRSNVLQWFDPVFSGNPGGDPSSRSTDTQRGASAQPVQRPQSMRGGAHAGFDRTRGTSIGGGAPGSVYSSSYPGDAFFALERAWNARDSGLALDRNSGGGGGDAGGVSLFPALPPMPSEGGVSMINGSSTNESFFLPQTGFAAQESQVFAATNTSATHSLATPAFAPFPTLNPSEALSKADTSITVSSKEATSSANSTRVNDNAEALLQMALSQAAGLHTESSLYAAIPPSGLDTGTLQASLDAPFAPYPSTNSQDGPSHNPSSTLE